MTILRPAISLFVVLTLLVGVGYPLLTTGLAQWWFPSASKGSLIVHNGEVRGSALIGQNFTRPDYFQGRPSATGDKPYNGLASSGSNQAGSNPALDEAVKQRVADLRKANPDASATVPVDLVTASGSGLDPQISPAAAMWQAPRVAKARNLPEAEVKRLIDENTDKPLLYFIGEPVVNVLQLNMALDSLQKK
ncbi:TPA: potassium-transporting ATPase subunit KdpC [Klebsiella quasipneumoniae subsp. similipneumoniae]|uniref:Potassium-transporting ATPase KdpC subunit n=1 Tax=Klebsiella quasipneumoniae TaxID=1463165 RepID=A0A483K8Y4_9ENTR|nr:MULTISPECIES: potassium-transporting ATPase subunit KdpC [Enterobacteriaceae]HCD1372004.1 potassium-transporting ATPase subunit KdpC [Klebsiella pneumoniae subsp. pneumoniae]EKM5948642.1 potassium-transporting ATPase subunit KdpC [Klebsiella pneumoniae]ELI6994126.1 potassium-transporting ATPase subunit KdpC [Klebsiella pneumoniae]ELK6589332.1 potassium-transporting ATPase subunit KdpC [Escherichia coli]MBE4999764.1 potassium-transporting ATPase subunit KdpC [Klebsiella pneumoniae]